MTPETLAAQRQAWRATLLAARKTMPDALRATADAGIDTALRRALGAVSGGVLGFYWPIQAEYDARPAVGDWLAAGAGRLAALPVVVGRDQPLRFRHWTPGAAMQPAGFGTSVPSSGEWLLPTILLIPLVGYDEAGYRLGYGGGYYDRTLAAWAHKPRTIGIGYAAGRLPTIHPQPHDLPLSDIIVA